MIASITASGLTMGSYSTGYIFNSFAGLGTPELRIDVRDKGNFDGARLGLYNYGRRVIRIEGELYGTSSADFEDKRRALLKAFAIDQGLQTITIQTHAGNSVFIDAILNASLEVPYSKGQMTFCDFRLELVAPDPFFRSSTLNESEVFPFTGGGYKIPFSIPLSLGSGGSGATTITNNGNGIEFPIIKIFGAIENPSIQNSTLGKTLSINYSIPTSTDYIELNTETRTATFNGIINISDKIGTDWWYLQTGDNIIKLSSASYSGSSKAIVYHYDRYLGI